MKFASGGIGGLDGVSDRAVFFLNKELLEWDAVKNQIHLREAIRCHFGDHMGSRWVFVDEIQDNHPENVLTLDEDHHGRRKGIILQNIRDFLVSE
ncbi:MAG: hypothetical protein ABIJ86_01765 [Spirochaetota bacterium]